MGIFLAGDGRLRHTSAFQKGPHAVSNGTLSTSIRVGPQAWEGTVLGGAVHIIAKAFGARLRQSNGLYYAIGCAINSSPAALSAFLEGAMKGSVGLLENIQVVGVIASPLRPKRTVKNVKKVQIHPKKFVVLRYHILAAIKAVWLEGTDEHKLQAKDNQEGGQ